MVVIDDRPVGNRLDLRDGLPRVTEQGEMFGRPGIKDDHEHIRLIC